MIKKGDDLRQDILTLQLFKVMQNLWFDNGLMLKMSLYSVISTGYFQGMLHIVEDSETLATIHKKYGGATVPLFSNKPLKEWLEKTSSVPLNDWEFNFLLSCSAYCVATFVLGIGDRHNDNIMVKKVTLFLIRMVNCFTSISDTSLVILNTSTVLKEKELLLYLLMSS